MQKTKIITLPIVPLRNMVVFPDAITNFDAGRKKSIAAIETAESNGGAVFLTCQKDGDVIEPGEDGFYKYGTIATIKQTIKLPGGIVRVLVEGSKRGKIESFTDKDAFFEGEILSIDEDMGDENRNYEAAKRLLAEDLFKFQELNPKIFPGLLSSVVNDSTYSSYTDTIASCVEMSIDDAQKLLETLNLFERMKLLHQVMQKENELLTLEKKIDDEVQSRMNKVQKEYYLKEQIKVIRDELGESEENLSRSYEEKIKLKKLPEEVREKALKEAAKLSEINQMSPEYTVLVNYLDWILDLPWLEGGDENIDIKKARTILDKEHYGLKNVKERILEFIAVRKLAKKPKGTILLLVGPPGVGKTSIATSIAHALDKNFVRMSLGGVRDEAEIRGHRRTYVGALPGRVMSLMKRAKQNNPVFLFDEIDKVGNDYRGDPASALLEVLDPEQNQTFTDHYLELPFDLSKVFFVTTANTTATIPAPLLDRMEVISIEGYTAEEKFNIAKKYLVGKQLKDASLTKKAVRISDGAIRDIIDYYTKEAGVRALVKQIAKIVRKAALKIVEEDVKTISVTSRNLSEYLGERVYRIEDVDATDQVGVVKGLAWTQVGGTTLDVEVITMEGTGKLVLTGSLGDVMKESAKASMSYMASNATKLGIDPEALKKLDIHVHVPEGAVPKDGPSAGITIATALYSALTDKRVDRLVAMTGEITLRGKVLPIGGLKEKLLAAERVGVKKAIVPYENKKDVREIEEEIELAIDIVYVKDVLEVFKEAIKE